MNATVKVCRPPGSFKRQGWFLAVALVVLDQFSKWLIVMVFAQNPHPIQVFPFFNIVLVWNRGISFGAFNELGAWGPWVLIILSLVISLVFARWLARSENLWTALGIGAIIGGAIGNVIDRLRFGAVVDFLDVSVLGYHWPAFNVADSAITGGAVILVLESLLVSSHTQK